MRRILSVLLLIAPAAALASQGGRHEGDHISGQWLTLLFTVVNFSLFVFLIVRFARSPLREFLLHRRTELVEAMSAAARAQEEAARVKVEYAEKVAQLEQTRAELIDEVRAIAEAERRRGLAAAHEAASRLQRDAELRAKSELEQARRELRAEAAALAAEMAGNDIRERLGDDTRRRLLAELIGEVERS